MSNPFDDLRDAFLPTYASESALTCCKYVGSIPSDLFVMNEPEGYLTYQGRRFSKRTVSWDIREDGPGAWGCGLTIPADAFVRWHSAYGGENAWYLTTKQQYITIESGGRSLEIISLNNDGSVNWVMNSFDAI